MLLTFPIYHSLCPPPPYITKHIIHLLTQLLHALNIQILTIIMHPPLYINKPIIQLLTQLLHAVNIPILPIIMPPFTLHY
jgi:hypothetical protein